MATWGEFAAADPELAAFGDERFQATHVAYLATCSAGGFPRVHPVTPIIGGGRLFLFMEPTSPKGHDLRRDGRFALHSSVADDSGTDGEFSIGGRALPIEDPAIRAAASDAANYTPADRYVLFELSVEHAHSTVYDERGQSIRRRWSER